MMGVPIALLKIPPCAVPFSILDDSDPFKVCA
jgi:hypothetical protein